MFSMCGLLCRFLRGWRQSEAVGIMVHAASLKDASLVVEAIGTCSKFSSSLQDGENHQSLFCQPLCGGQETRQKQLLWRDNSKQATLASPKETVNLVRWTVFLTKSPYQKDDFRRDCSHAAASAPSTPLDSSPRTSRKNSTCSDCDNVITVLLEASYREKEEESLYGYNVMVEHLAEPYAWKVRDMFGVIIYTTPTKLVSMIHAFFNNALVIDEDLSIRKILTVDLVGEPSCLTDPSTISESVTPGPWSHSNSLTQMELARASSPGPEEVSSSNPNLARGGSPFATRGIPLSSSFTSSPFRRSHAGASPGYSPGFSPVKRGLASQGKSITSPGNDSCPASPLFEEEEFDFPLAEEEEEERVVKEEVRAPNVLVYTANNPDYFEDVKETLNSTFAKNRYVIYHLTDEMAFRSPWKACTTLLVVCGDVPTHVSTVFIRYLLSGGKVLSICSDFLNVAVPLFGTVEVQEASVVSMSYGKWKNVQLLHHQHCFHSSPKHKRISKDLEKKVSNTGSAVSVEPTFVEITDEYGTRHRLDLQVLAKDDTWGAPALLVADVNEGKGKALFSQVHLEKNPNVSICFNLRGEQLKKCNEWRLEILKDLLSTHLTMDAEGGSEEKQSSTIPSNSPAFLLAEHEAKQKFMNQIKPYMSDGKFSRPSFTLKFQKHTTETPSKDQSFLPVFTTGCPTNFSTVKYFEGLKTTTIGRVVIYSEVISSTMDIIRGSPPIGNGVVVLTTQQTKGKGRQGNVWLSPLGCNMFSLQLHFPLSSNMGQCLPFLQHIIALSAILAVKGTPGYERIPLYLKWPNDIYLGKENKIGGVIVEGSTQKKTVIANVGCGVNLWNSVPTSCVNKAIRDYNASEGTQLEEFGRETFCANLFSQMEMLLNEFQDNGPDRVIAEYYKHWLHGNARVTVQNELGVREAALVSGIDQYGFLIAELSSGETVLLHPDGNSFNMMEGLLYTKIPTGTA